MRKAIEEYIDDLEDLHLAEEATRRIESVESTVINSEEFWRGLLDD